ncbi:DgyrCDS1079 [Dimorphilus gyrociliatus]|uniref:DgyrCDS1079 n=1 Tax=Dimorphilus gyrociliatus TaxID=2664684 RepID=A0A7I8V6I7_9ANNE|nr:DgyrCDS1079 [Dimorphilus gyrociliatus]
MAHMQERLLQLISKDFTKRNHQEILGLLPWLRKRSPLFLNLHTDLIVDIIKECEYERIERDEVVIKQGEIGDCFFIILTGTVSIYIDTAKSEEDSNFSPTRRTNVVKRRSARADTGHSEVFDDEKEDDWDNSITESRSSPVSPDKQKSPTRRRATKQQLRQRKYSLDRSKYGNFILQLDAGKSFGELALINEDSSRNATVITDETCDFLVVDRSLYERTLKNHQEAELNDRKNFVNHHILFKKWPPRLKNLLIMSLIKEMYQFDSLLVQQGQKINGLIFLRRGKALIECEPLKHEIQYPNQIPFITTEKEAILQLDMRRKVKNNCSKSIRNKRVETRRFGGYASAEQQEREKNVCLCHVGEGEIIGDLEMACDLSTYAVTVKSNAATDAYILTKNNVERLFNRKAASDTLKILRELFFKKLTSRLKGPKAGDIPLLSHLYFVLQTPPPKSHSLPEFALGQKAKAKLPDDEMLFSHQLQQYSKGRAELCLPILHESYYLKHSMQERARIRKSVQKHNSQEIRAKRHRRTMQPPKARSLKALRMALNEHEEKAIKKQREEIVAEIKRQRDEELKYLFENAIKQKENLPKLPKFYRRLEENIDNLIKKEPLPSIPIEPKIDQDLSACIENSDTSFQSESMISKSEISELKTGDTQIIMRKGPPYLMPIKEKTVISEFKENDEIKSEEESEKDIEIQEQQEYQKLNNDKQNIERPLSNVFLWKKYRSVASRHPSYRDWETSDKTLSFLEDRLRQFRTPKQKVTFLPKLKRFETNDHLTEDQPKPGGRVLVKSTRCPEGKSERTFANHEHVRYSLVETLPNYQNLHKNKLLQHMFMDKAIESYKKTTTGETSNQVVLP